MHGIGQTLNEYLSKSSQNLVYYLSALAVRRRPTAYLNFCSLTIEWIEFDIPLNAEISTNFLSP